MPVDVFGTEQHFRDHLAPIYAALHEPGRFYAPGDPLEESDNPILVMSYGDLKKVRRAGRTRIALGEHGYGQSYSNDHGSYAGGQGRDDVSLFLVPNEHAAQRNVERNPGAKVVIVGCAKLDMLPARDADPEGMRPSSAVIALSFHFDAHSVAPEATGTLRHYRSVFKALARELNIVGHGHPRHAPILARHYRKNQIEFVPDFTDVCRRADLYVCDTSSTIYEFASTGRPVVVLNGPQYRRNISHGLRYWDAADVGIQVDNPAELRDAIHLALTDPPEQQAKREAALDLVYAYRSGGAKRAADALAEWAA